MKDKQAAVGTKAVPKTDENEDQVKLKPIMGIRPGVYLTALYSIILLTIVFFLLVNPGIKNPTAALIVNTTPQGAAIRVNNVYMGTSGSKIILREGRHKVEAVMPGFDSVSAIYAIPGRVIGSLFFPRQKKINITLETADPVKAFSIAAADFAAWSFGGEPTEAWQIPMSLSEGAYRVGAYTDVKEQNRKVLLAASRFTVTRAALRDLIRAKILIENNGLSPSPVSLISSISDVIHFLSEQPGAAAWLSGILPHRTASVIRDSAWASNEYEAETDFFPDFEAPQVQTRFELTGLNHSLNFIGKGAGRLLVKGTASVFRPFGYNIYVNNFMISEKPVSRSLFEIFLNENPEWSEHHTNYYPDEIAVNPAAAPDREAITGITWYAAEAFCQWLTTMLPPAMAGMEVRLPTEAEWEYSFLSIENTQNAGWEWCNDHYAPLQFIKAPPENPYSAITVNSPERSLRGRSSYGSVETRTSLPPDFSSPFVTFRVVIAPVMMAEER